MTMIVALIIFTLIVVALLLYPVKKQPMSFDEKAEVIKIYRQEVAYITMQHSKGLIDDDEQQQLLAEADKKSSLAMLAVEEKSFAYRSAVVPMIVFVIGVCVAGAVYFKFYTEQNVERWQTHGAYYNDSIIKGLFSREVVEKNLADTTSSRKQQVSYCFLLQKEMFANYPHNSEALVNVAECHLQLGLTKQAHTAIQKALQIDENHLRANYLFAELQFLQLQRLLPQTQKKLTALFEHNPTAIDIGYLLMVEHFAKGQFDTVRAYADKLRPYLKDNPLLQEAIDELLMQIGTREK